MNIIQDFEYGFSRDTEINYLIMQLNFFKNGGYNQFINFREIANYQNAFIPRMKDTIMEIMNLQFVIVLNQMKPIDMWSMINLKLYTILSNLQRTHMTI